jgi:phenylalanyl-tRNA synthetase beta chain
LKVSLEWLSEYVDLVLSPERLADVLSMAGTEVERIHTLGARVSGVVVARVVKVKEHPNADRLRIAVVDDGAAEREVVCGAPNLKAGMVSALALPGALLPASPDTGLSESVIRGVMSHGMLLSEDELGLSDDRGGIIELEAGAVVGSDIHEVLPLEDMVLELEITPNRPDCMSVVGIAREVAALTGGEFRWPYREPVEDGGPAGDLLKVRLVDRIGCPRYSARVVTGVEIRPSPAWMQRRLVASGMRPISNVVDITNYVLLEMGQPLHAFDMDLLTDTTIVVRKAEPGERMTTLDGVERALDEDCLMIADAARAVAIAGIMGGEDSEVTDATRNVVIESAYFDPTAVMLTSRRLALRTEASSRFERGTDPGGTARAADRAAELMRELAGGTVAVGVIDEYPEPIVPVAIELRPDRVNRVLGTDIEASEMAGILGRLEAEVEGKDALRVTAPTFRPDLEREIDLIEEIARVHGYDRIPSLLPAGGGLVAGLTREQVRQAKLVDGLVSLGLSEAITYSFMRPGDLELMRLSAEDPLRGAVTLINPVAETGEAMRTTLLPGLLRLASSNLNKGNRDLAVFECGRVFMAGAEGGLPEEVERVGILICGRVSDAGWPTEDRAADFFDLKGLVEDALSICGTAVKAVFSPAEAVFLLRGRAAELLLDSELAGLLGQLDPAVAVAFDIDCEVYVAEMSRDLLTGAADVPRPYVPVGRFPNVKVDIAVVVDSSVEARQIEEEIHVRGGELLRAARLFDVYEGPQIPEGRKSLAYALEFGSAEGTLTDTEAHERMDGIIEGLRERFGASIRGRDSIQEDS